MVNKTIAEKQKKMELNPIDYTASKFKTQRRSPPFKPRSDFSSLVSFPCSSASSVSDLVSFDPDVSSLAGTSSDDACKVEENEWLDLPLVYYRKFADKKSKPLSEFYEAPVVGVESVAQNTVTDHCRDSDQRRTMTMESTTEKPRITESSSVCPTPGNVVWAKTNQEIWWPAEVVSETSSVAESRSQNGHVLVQFYGDQGSAWVDPARDLSQLEDCFEERSCNATDKFQDALKQALKKKGDLSSHRQLLGPSNESTYSYQQDQPSDKHTSSISSRTECDYSKRKEGKRKQKTKTCSDKVVFPPTSARKVRRFKIMRNLGLIAPIGSPF